MDLSQQHPEWFSVPAAACNEGKREYGSPLELSFEMYYRFCISNVEGGEI